MLFRSRRGSARLGALLPLVGAVRGSGCAAPWFQVGPWAYVCGSVVALSELPAPDAAAEVRLSPTGLPYRYAFVGRDGAFGYAAYETAEEGVPLAQLQPGFGVAIEQVRSKANSESFGLTTRGFWLPLRDLNDVVPNYFQGAAWSESLAWVKRDRAPLFSAPGVARTGQSATRLTAVAVQAVATRGGVRYAKVGDEDWLRESDLVRPQRSEPPSEARSHERWLDIALDTQTLVAYSGNQPIFATLVSTGRGARNTETATPEGTFRVWVKLRASDMDNIEDAQARENYAIEAVPWVMFFQRGYGLHGTFWHQRFGEVRSHGCVNLAPRDAERLFHFASPRLLPGWSAVLPTPGEPGTLVRVRATNPRR